MNIKNGKIENRENKSKRIDKGNHMILIEQNEIDDYNNSISILEKFVKENKLSWDVYNIVKSFKKITEEDNCITVSEILDVFLIFDYINYESKNNVWNNMMEKFKTKVMSTTTINPFQISLIKGFEYQYPNECLKPYNIPVARCIKTNVPNDWIDISSMLGFHKVAEANSIFLVRSIYDDEEKDIVKKEIHRYIKDHVLTINSLLDFDKYKNLSDIYRRSKYGKDLMNFVNILLSYFPSNIPEFYGFDISVTSDGYLDFVSDVID